MIDDIDDWEELSMVLNLHVNFLNILKIQNKF